MGRIQCTNVLTGATARPQLSATHANARTKRGSPYRNTDGLPPFRGVGESSLPLDVEFTKEPILDLDVEIQELHLYNLSTFDDTKLTIPEEAEPIAPNAAVRVGYKMSP